MSTVVSDALRKVVGKVKKGKKPDWNSYQLQSAGWERISKIIVDALDEIKGHGVDRPLATLQELAFTESLKADSAENKKTWPLHTVALWLTNTRMLANQYTETKNDDLKEVMKKRGLLKVKRRR